MIRCPYCGKESAINNACRCDPNNLPTRVPTLNEIEAGREPTRDGSDLMPCSICNGWYQHSVECSRHPRNIDTGEQ